MFFPSSFLEWFDCNSTDLQHDLDPGTYDHNPQTNPATNTQKISAASEARKLHCIVGRYATDHMWWQKVKFLWIWVWYNSFTVCFEIVSLTIFEMLVYRHLISVICMCLYDIEGASSKKMILRVDLKSWFSFFPTQALMYNGNGTTSYLNNLDDFVFRPAAHRNLTNFHLTSRQKYNLGVLIHVLTSNPKILYAPNNTQVDDVIRKVATSCLNGFWL